MLFTSFQFLFLFLPILYALFLIVSRRQKSGASSLLLLLASLSFYLFWNPADLWPLLISIVFNYIFYLLIRNSDQYFNGTLGAKNWILFFAIACNLLFLGYYKYLHFIINEWVPASIFGLSPEFKEKLVVFGLKGLANPSEIPLGISFYTFTQIAFLVDCSRLEFKRNNFIQYSLFVSYFPHLVCGPILSFKDLYPQLNDDKKFRPSLDNSCLFIFCFCIGLFKKAVIGDTLGSYANLIFSGDPGRYFDPFTANLGVLCYSLQLYFDFSGYSDMAVGLSYLFGLKIPDNFNAPYQSTSIIEFWRRWHISLSNFLKNYVYIPLGGNRCSQWKIFRNLWITMILGGFWHGASWTFLLWGVYQGLLLSLNHNLRRILNTSFFNVQFVNFNAHPNKLFKAFCNTKTINAIKIAITFILISLGWVLFRSQNSQQALHIYQSLLGLHGQEGISLSFQYKLQWFVLVLGLLIVFFVPDTCVLRDRFNARLSLSLSDSQTMKATISKAVGLAAMALLSVLCFSRVQYFLYSGF